jgi:hypothetical protein
MAVVGFDITARQPYEGPFRPPYERVDGVATYAVDPNHWANAGIVDLDLAPTDDAGRVVFQGDVTMLRPLDTGRGRGARGTGVVEVPNRGRRTLLSLYNRAAPVLEPTAEIDPGDGFLLDRGFTVAWCGWQWDVPRSPARMGLAAPVADVEGELQLRFQLPNDRETVPLTDQHTGPLGRHEPIPTRDRNDQAARLLVRDGIYDDPVTIDRSSWRFVDDTTVALDGGFEAGRIYDLIYWAPRSPVAGAGLLAVRDLGRYLRLTEGLDHMLATGQSQCGRFLRTFLHLGLNTGDDGAPAYDGVLAHIAGARRGEFNHRLAQPSVQPTPSFGHLFPFADEPQTDPATGDSAGLLDRQHAHGAVPKIIYTNTASEYWRGDASLAHTSAVDGSDVEPPTVTRHYLFASTQHGPGMLPLLDESFVGAKGGNTFNVIDYTPLMRAAIMNLAAWVEEAVEPPPNAVPQLVDGTAVTRAEVLRQLADERVHLPAVTLPTQAGLTAIHPLDLGPATADGIGRYPAQITGEQYPSVVSAIDDDGNEVAGIAMPDVAVPVGTHTGWNPRRRDTGAPEQLLDYAGSTVPFTPAMINERYADEAAYLDRVELAAEKLVLEGYLLPEDVDVCRRIAAKRYRAFSERG